MSPLEIAAVITSALGIWQTTRRSLVSWPVNLLACALYAAVFHDARLYSDMMLQGVYAVFCAYGWWYWYRGVREEGTVRVVRVAWKGWLWGGVAGTTGSLLLGYVMAHYTDAALPHIDAALTAFCLVAQWWSARKYLANWVLWILVDIVYTGVFAYKHLFLTSGLYAFFVFLAALGFRAWRKALAGQEAEFVSAEVNAGVESDPA
ncbi:MAG: aminotransferase [Acidobacteria bacterium]|nr:MAG: aminotransferase [Acidobacteriota bacterium]